MRSEVVIITPSSSVLGVANNSGTEAQHSNLNDKHKGDVHLHEETHTAPVVCAQL